MAKYTNTANLYEDSSKTTPLVTATSDYNTFDATSLTMSKTVNNPNSVYFPNDPITFTIQINNTSTTAINGLYFQDTIDPSVVPLSGTDFTITSTSGTVTSTTSPITITSIDVPAGGTVTISIQGMISSTTNG